MYTAAIGPQSTPLIPASSIDPVCGMTVKVGMAAATLKCDGKQYLFCSEACQHKFQESPAKYLVSADGGGLPPAAPDHGAPMQVAMGRALSGQAKDPVCGMVVNKATALRSDRGGEAITSAVRVVNAPLTRPSRK